MNKFQLKERLRYFVKQNLDRFPLSYMALLKYKYRNHWFLERIVSDTTDLVIEGFPRSANSFAVQAFKIAQTPNEVSIATHVHSPSHIISAVKQNKPTLVLIRDPKTTLLSLRALSMQVYPEQSEELLNLSFDYLASYYINFYEKIIPYKDKIVLGEFKQVTSDFGNQIVRVNKKFGTHFLLKNNEPINDKEVFKKGGYHLSPSKERNDYKIKLDESFDKHCSPKLKKQMYTTYNQVLKIIDQY